MAIAKVFKATILTSAILIFSETSAMAEPLAECINSGIKVDDSVASEITTSTLTNIAESILNYHHTQGPDATKLQLRLAVLEAESETLKKSWSIISLCYDVYLLDAQN